MFVIEPNIVPLKNNTELLYISSNQIKSTCILNLYIHMSRYTRFNVHYQVLIFDNESGNPSYIVLDLY